eukprot:4810801-Amphidinium_carterae.1
MFFFPRPQKLDTGRPDKADLLKVALYSAIAKGTLPGGATSQPPSWWRDGLPLQVSEDDASRLVAEAMEDAKLEESGCNT